MGSIPEQNRWIIAAIVASEALVFCNPVFVSAALRYVAIPGWVVFLFGVLVLFFATYGFMHIDWTTRRI